MQMCSNTEPQLGHEALEKVLWQHTVSPVTQYQADLGDNSQLVHKGS